MLGCIMLFVSPAYSAWADHLAADTVLLDGTATAGDILLGKTAYATDTATKLTGTLAPSAPTRVVTRVREKPVYVQVPVEVPTEVEQISLKLNKVLLEQKIRKRNLIQTLMKE